MTDEQLADILVEILNEGMFEDIYMRGDGNKNELRRTMTEKGVSDEQVDDIQERFEIQSRVTFTEVLDYLIGNLNPEVDIP